MKMINKVPALLIGLALLAQPAFAETDPAKDPRIAPQVREFLDFINKDPSPFWQLPQPKPQEILTSIQDKYPVDMSGVKVTEREIEQDGRKVKIYIMKPEKVVGKPGAVLFIHGGVWIVGNFKNHERLLRDIVVGTGQVGVFVEYTPLPEAKFPTQPEECYAALKWIAEHGKEIGVDGKRIAVAGNSVGGNMAAALTLMAKDRKGPKISYQVLMVPATDASVDSGTYQEFATGRFLSRDFMKYGWDLYAPDAKTRDNPYVSPLRASDAELKDLPPALIITAENDPLRDDGESYAQKLQDLGDNVTSTRYNGTIHDFVALNALRHVPSTIAALEQINEGIREHLKP